MTSSSRSHASARAQHPDTPHAVPRARKRARGGAQVAVGVLRDWSVLRAAACGAVRVLLPAVAAWTSSVVIVRGVRRRVCIFETPDVCSGVQHSSIHSIHVMCKVFSNPCHYNFADTHPTMAARIFSSAAHGAVRFGGGASRRVHTARRWLSTTRAARPRRVAAVLDIDGVCMLGQQVLPGVPDAL